MYLVQWNQYQNGSWPTGKMIFRNKRKGFRGEMSLCEWVWKWQQNGQRKHRHFLGCPVLCIYIQKTTNTRNNHYASWLWIDSWILSVNVFSCSLPFRTDILVLCVFFLFFFSWFRLAKYTPMSNYLYFEGNQKKSDMERNCYQTSYSSNKREKPIKTKQYINENIVG